jgi:rhodanese-related sulfurtransferase
MIKEPVVQTISVEKLKNHYDNDPNFCLIDVRELSEWQEAHIPKATLICKDAIREEIQKTVTDFNTPIYLHCKGGVRSMYAAQTLLELGYTNVYSVEGGIIAWAAAGFPTIVID